jgi:hypothetical protein
MIESADRDMETVLVTVFHMIQEAREKTEYAK